MRSDVALCAHIFVLVFATLSKAQTAAPNTTGIVTSSSLSPTTTNAHPNPTVNRICPGNAGTTDRVRVNAIRAHNYRRSRLTQGLIRRNNGNLMPRASNMMSLVYDCNLENSARETAQRCTDTSTTAAGGLQGNMFLFSRSRAQFRKDAIVIATRHWWRQVRLVDGVGARVLFKQRHVFSRIASFTRMAWATTSRLGCFVAPCPNNRWGAACHYSPGGNIVGNPLYAIGEPCSTCPTGTFCNEARLCAPISSLTAGI